ncbi:MAG: type II secretion system protein [Dehalococcoidales bacterium]|nr:type II secretion system protein [Dehalococcoidales bacterium]
MRCRKSLLKNSQSGMTLIESIVAIAILSAISVVFLGGLVVSSKGTLESDEQATAESVARCQMEWVQGSTYVDNATQYIPMNLDNFNDYVGYSANISAEPLHSPDDGIQKVTITVFHNGNWVMSIEGYKRK